MCLDSFICNVLIVANTAGQHGRVPLNLRSETLQLRRSEYALKLLREDSLKRLEEGLLLCDVKKKVNINYALDKLLVIRNNPCKILTYKSCFYHEDSSWNKTQNSVVGCAGYGAYGSFLVLALVTTSSL